MTKKFIYILLLLSSFCFRNIQAQEDKPVFYEKLDQGLIRFYFDKYYYLAAKDCEFKSIERVSKFDFTKQIFDGEFRDFAPNGGRMLVGNYREGKKEGLFQAFHPNGVLKWEINFKDNYPVGDWKYYYPDGKPLLTISYGDFGYFIKDYWDNRGKQEVVDGEGNYEFAIPFEGFTEFGYDFYLRKGKVKGGKPQGNWNTYFYTMCRNMVYDYFKRAKVELKHREAIFNYQIEKSKLYSENSIEKEIDLKIEINSLCKDFKLLSYQQKMIVYLNKVKNLSIKEIAIKLNISPFTVRNHLHRALKKIRVLFLLCSISSLLYPGFSYVAC